MNCSRCGEPLDALHVVDGCPKRPSDEVIEQATKAMHAEVCCPCDPQGCDWAHTPEARYARALADAGLLALRITIERDDRGGHQ